VTGGGVSLREATLEELAARYGGCVEEGTQHLVMRVVPVERASAGDLAPVLASRFVRAAGEAAKRGAALLVHASIAPGVTKGARWVHPNATWAVAELLDDAIAPDTPAVVGEACVIHASAVLGPRVSIGARVRIGAGAVIGHPGFGWAMGADGAVRAVPQLGGVVIEDDVSIGSFTTVDAGTLSPTIVRRGAKLDAHVHVAHNCDIGEGTIVAAQSGFAGSVVVGARVLVGGQVGVSDHVRIGDGARIAAKSGVIGDVPAGAVMAGYPAVPRMRWLRALARIYRKPP
jgi:UDP-3-O-[3-hydroxymyristoyl] glucosamine N-acyltransferase